MIGETEWRAHQEPLKTFVGGLPYHCDEADLENFMKRFGVPEQIFISKDASGQHKGFAFVSFTTLDTTQQLFGEHNFKSKIIEVKRNLLNHLYLENIYSNISISDIKNSLGMLGFPLAEVILGTGFNGLPTKTACAKLSDEGQMPQAASIRKLEINGCLVELVAKFSKRIASKAVKESPTRRKYNKKAAELESNNSNQIQPAVLLNEFNSVSSSHEGIFQNELKIRCMDQSKQSSLASTLSNADVKESLDLCSFSGDKRRKLSNSLKTDSKEYFPFQRKVDSLGIVREEIRMSTLKSFEDFGGDNDFLYLPRHNSESLAHSEFFEGENSRRLSSYSSSFFSSNSPLRKNLRLSLMEVRVAFFTFPGRE